MSNKIIIGTAGHIDHGKTALVKALTGTDTDRLKEEQERGVTIDIGFAFLTDDIAIIDVPGHERFIKNMVAGVSTIDFVLFIIAADDGVMPQTREHLDILHLLQVESGIVVLTKIDLVETEWLGMVEDDIRALLKNTFLKKAPLMRVSSVTGVGIDELKKTIFNETSKLPSISSDGIFRLPVDRSFTIKGFGTVITGTVQSGIVNSGDAIELLPQKRLLRVRALQSHGNKIDHVEKGSRAAINLQGIEKEEISRGDILAAPDYFIGTRLLDAELYLLKNTRKQLKHRDRVRLHIGTNEIMARVFLLDVEELKPGNSCLLQFRLEKDGTAVRGEHFVIRRYSPPFTIGGGKIIDPKPNTHKRFDKQIINSLKVLKNGNVHDLIEERLKLAGWGSKTVHQLAGELNFSPKEIQSQIDRLKTETKIYLLDEKILHKDSFDEISSAVIMILKDYHKGHSLLPGIRKAELKSKISFHLESKLFDLILNTLNKTKKIKIREGFYSLYEFTLKINKEKEQLVHRIYSILQNSIFTPPSVSELTKQMNLKKNEIEGLLNIVIFQRKVIKVDDNYYYDSVVIDKIKNKVSDFFNHKNEMTVSQLRTLIPDISRKYALPLANYLDTIGFTERNGDVRIFVDKKDKR